MPYGRNGGEQFEAGLVIVKKTGLAEAVNIPSFNQLVRGTKGLKAIRKDK